MFTIFAHGSQLQQFYVYKNNIQVVFVIINTDELNVIQ